MTNPKKTLPKWPIVVVVSAILIICLLSPVCRYLYTKDFVARYDAQLAELLDHDFKTVGIYESDKPVFFIGYNETVTNASCLDLSSGNYNIFSVFSAADSLQLDITASSQYIVSYLNKLGYHYTAPTAQDWAKCEAEIMEKLPLHKPFPWYESILETENCIIVQLKNTVK